VPVAHLLAARPIQQNGSQFFAYSVGVSLIASHVWNSGVMLLTEGLA